MSDPTRWIFGEAALPETRELAAAMRDLASAALALEHPADEIRRITAEMQAAEKRLRSLLPDDLRPRVGEPVDDNRRVYLDHSRDIGTYNACFPLYQLTCADDRAEGSVTFPIVYEGPPGIAHGGFVAVLFDCVLQQLNCDLGLAGKTATLSLRFRRPTPLLKPLRITAARQVRDNRIHSEAQLLDGTELLCQAEMTSVAGNRDALPHVSPRRPVTGMAAS